MPAEKSEWEICILKLQSSQCLFFDTWIAIMKSGGSLASNCQILGRLLFPAQSLQCFFLLPWAFDPFGVSERTKDVQESLKHHHSSGVFTCNRGPAGQIETPVVFATVIEQLSWKGVTPRIEIIVRDELHCLFVTLFEGEGSHPILKLLIGKEKAEHPCIYYDPAGERGVETLSEIILGDEPTCVSKKKCS